MMDRIRIEKNLLSFRDIPERAAQADKTVLLLRHSIRESLQQGLDPGLTEEGFSFARECGTFLKGIKKAAFGASPRRRTIQTAQALMQGGGFEEVPVAVYPQIRDTALFTEDENLSRSIAAGTLGAQLKTYFTTGKAEGMVDLDSFSAGVFRFLMETDFGSPCTILTSHDIVAVSLLLSKGVYPFEQEKDWCGYVQGAALFRHPGGDWSLCYTVPDPENRPLFTLFV